MRSTVRNKKSLILAVQRHNDDKTQQLRNILRDPDFIDACSNIYFWNIDDCPESIEIQRTVLHQQQNTPLLISFTFDASGAQMAPGVLTDLSSVQEVIDFIHRAVRVQQDQMALRRTRELRATQDAEYQATLQRDRDRARQREEERVRQEEVERERQHAQREEEERARAEEIERERLNAEAIREARENLPSEPLESEDTVNIRLRGPDGQVTRRTFYIGDSTQDLFRAAFAMLALPSQNFVLHRYQGATIENDGSSLLDLSLINNNTLLSIEMMDD